MKKPELVVRDLGTTEYESVWKQMRDYTSERGVDSRDELWFTEHRSVYTLGQAGNREHVLLPTNVPVVHTDRGGQVTFHGIGQIVGYFLVDLKRLHVSVHDFVCRLEQTMIDTLEYFGLKADRLAKNPGVYVEGRKIGSLGIRVRRGCTYHGISLNVAMDLTAFETINPCGIVGMKATDMRTEGIDTPLDDVKSQLSLCYQRLQQSDSQKSITEN